MAKNKFFDLSKRKFWILSTVLLLVVVILLISIPRTLEKTTSQLKNSGSSETTFSWVSKGQLSGNCSDTLKYMTNYGHMTYDNSSHAIYELFANNSLWNKDEHHFVSIYIYGDFTCTERVYPNSEIWCDCDVKS